MHKYTFTDGHFGTGLFEIAPGVYMKPSAFANHINNVISQLAANAVLVDTGVVVCGKRVLIEQGAADEVQAKNASDARATVVQALQKVCDYTTPPKPKTFPDILPDFLKRGKEAPKACPHGHLDWDQCPDCCH